MPHSKFWPRSKQSSNSWKTSPIKFWEGTWWSWAFDRSRIRGNLLPLCARYLWNQRWWYLQPNQLATSPQPQTSSFSSRRKRTFNILLRLTYIVHRHLNFHVLCVEKNSLYLRRSTPTMIDCDNFAENEDGAVDPSEQTEARTHMLSQLKNPMRKVNKGYIPSSGGLNSNQNVRESPPRCHPGRGESNKQQVFSKCYCRSTNFSRATYLIHKPKRYPWDCPRRQWNTATMILNPLHVARGDVWEIRWRQLYLRNYPVLQIFATGPQRRDVEIKIHISGGVVCVEWKCHASKRAGPF